VDVEAGVASPDTRKLRFDLTGAPGYYHVEARCAIPPYEGFYAMGVVVR